jgi:hypothetical protein
MKKIFAIMMVAFLAVFTVSCSSCHRDDNLGANEGLTYEVTGLNVERTNALDNEYMTANFGDYRWLECCIDAEDWMDESDVFNVKGIANIYSVVEYAPDSMSGMMYVYLIAHTADTSVITMKEGLWVGDDPMNEYNNPFKVDFAHAYDAMMKANCVKPHSRHCVLRREVGENNIEPIYIFGNQDAQVYVSTETGNVTTTNPAYNEHGYDGNFRLNYAFTW